MKIWLSKLSLALLFCASITSTYAEKQQYFTLSSTTSIENSGLLDYLIPKFKQKTGITVRVIASGTGRALLLGERGDADIVLVHHKTSEEKFVAKGYGIKRCDVMYNDFIIVGPQQDPANIKALNTATEVFRQIREQAVPFVSRGDESGTHKKELELWSLAKIDVQQHSGAWYREVGAGMGTTLNIANSMSAYTITDRGTWLSFKNRKNLALLFENDPLLFNQYGMILVNPKHHRHVKYKQAKQFYNWLISNEGQQAISDYTLEGQQLFFPNAQKVVSKHVLDSSSTVPYSQDNHMLDVDRSSCFISK